MSEDKRRIHYLSMLTGLMALQDDLEANDAPDVAKGLLQGVIEECREDFAKRFDDPD